MTVTTLPQITVSFAQLNSLAAQLRQAGACFNVTATGENRLLQFRQLTPAAKSLLRSLETPVSAEVETEPTPEATQQYATFEEIMSKTKREMKKLAQQFNIPINSKLRKEELARSLVGKIVC